MKLHEIIALNDEAKKSILIELLIPYKKLLLAYYKREFLAEPILMVTSVSNACQYGKIVSANELDEAICEYLDDYNCMDEESENFSEYETICFNSIMLAKL